jgi:hypothetical protein
MKLFFSLLSFTRNYFKVRFFFLFFVFFYYICFFIIFLNFFVLNNCMNVVVGFFLYMRLMLLFYFFMLFICCKFFELIFFFQATQFLVWSVDLYYLYYFLVLLNRFFKNIFLNNHWRNCIRYFFCYMTIFPSEISTEWSGIFLRTFSVCKNIGFLFFLLTELATNDRITDEYYSDEHILSAN